MGYGVGGERSTDSGNGLNGLGWWLIDDFWSGLGGPFQSSLRRSSKSDG